MTATPEWSSPRLAELAATAPVWSRKEFERYCRNWHREVDAQRREPNRARARRHATGRVALLG